MTGAAEIRLLGAADREAWLPLWRGYQHFYKTDIPADTTAVLWTRLLDGAEPMVGALAWQDKEAVGLVHLIKHRSCWTVGDYCYLQDLFVRAGCRGGGIGRHLVEFGYRWARAAGCSRVHWLTRHDNTQAMKLYDRLADRSGFIQYRKLFDTP